MIKKMVEQRVSKQLSKLPFKFQWTLHNMVAHPLMEVLYLVGLKDTSEWVHKVTVPPNHEEEPQFNPSLL